LGSNRAGRGGVRASETHLPRGADAFTKSLRGKKVKTAQIKVIGFGKKVRVKGKERSV